MSAQKYGRWSEAMTWAQECDLHVSPKAVLSAIVLRLDRTGSCVPSQERLSKDTGLSVRTVADCLAYLEDEGMIARQRRQAARGRTSDRVFVHIGVTPGQTYGTWREVNRRDARPRSSTTYSYKGARQRVARERGPAKDYSCQCGETATTWTYDGTDRNERVSETGVRYSMDPFKYLPTCRRCKAFYMQPSRVLHATVAEELTGNLQKPSTELIQQDQFIALEFRSASSEEAREARSRAVRTALVESIAEMRSNLSSTNTTTLFRWYMDASTSQASASQDQEIMQSWSDLLDALHQELMQRTDG